MASKVMAKTSTTTRSQLEVFFECHRGTFFHRRDEDDADESGRAMVDITIVSDPLRSFASWDERRHKFVSVFRRIAGEEEQEAKEQEPVAEFCCCTSLEKPPNSRFSLKSHNQRKFFPFNETREVGDMLCDDESILDKEEFQPSGLQRSAISPSKHKPGGSRQLSAWKSYPCHRKPKRNKWLEFWDTYDDTNLLHERPISSLKTLEEQHRGSSRRSSRCLPSKPKRTASPPPPIHDGVSPLNDATYMHHTASIVTDAGASPKMTMVTPNTKKTKSVVLQVIEDTERLLQIPH